MSDTIHFDYGLFYNFYTDKHNKKIKTFSENQPIAYFYVKDKKTHKVTLSHDVLSKKYIKIDNTVVHIKKIGHNELLFSPHFTFFLIYIKSHYFLIIERKVTKDIPDIPVINTRV